MSFRDRSKKRKGIEERTFFLDNMIKDTNINSIIKVLEDISLNNSEIWAIYGTGNGAELLYEALCKLSLNEIVKFVIERDDRVCPDKEFHGVPIRKLAETADRLDGILIAAIDHHREIWERVLKNLTEEQFEHISVVDIFEYNTKAEQREYVEYIEKSILGKKREFVEFDECGYQRQKEDPKIIAWYLPQFHQLEINNKFHGQGFTEWTNTSKTIPLFTGHYQPHIPYDVGYYDLLNPDTIKRQIYLAKHYGIYGFCFHYYWFSGKKIMEKPLELLLKHKELDMPFCIDWATENWTALWDGGNREIMLEQNLQEGDAEKFMEDILPYMMDQRYIKIDGRPILVLYRVNIFEKEQVKTLLKTFREYAIEKGFPNLYIMVTNAFDFEEDVTEWGADALVEFPPHALLHFFEKYEPSGYKNPYYNGDIYDGIPFIEKKQYMLNHKTQVYFRSALTNWDNTARKALSKGSIIYGLTPETFKTWLTDIVLESRKIHSHSEDIVFVNSWNEWGEGSHLEPDMKYGYAYLQMVKDVLEDSRSLGN